MVPPVKLSNNEIDNRVFLVKKGKLSSLPVLHKKTMIETDTFLYKMLVFWYATIFI